MRQQRVLASSVAADRLCEHGIVQNGGDVVEAAAIIQRKNGVFERAFIFVKLRRAWARGDGRHIVLTGPGSDRVVRLETANVDLGAQCDARGNVAQAYQKVGQRNDAIRPGPAARELAREAPQCEELKPRLV